MACLRVTPLGRVGFFSLAEFELEAESAVEVEPEGRIYAEAQVFSLRAK